MVNQDFIYKNTLIFFYLFVCIQIYTNVYFMTNSQTVTLCQLEYNAMR